MTMTTGSHIQTGPDTRVENLPQPEKVKVKITAHTVCEIDGAQTQVFAGDVVEVTKREAHVLRVENKAVNVAEEAADDEGSDGAIDDAGDDAGDDVGDDSANADAGGDGSRRRGRKK